MRLTALYLFLWSSTIPLAAQLDTVRLPMREWTSTDGKTIRADLLGFEGEGVRLRLEGGQRTVVPESRLSPQDRAELVRVRFRDDYPFVPGEAAKTNFYTSRLTAREESDKGIVGLISIGPNRFLFELKIHSDVLDLRTRDRIEISVNGAAPVIHAYEPGQVATWASPPTETTRVVIQIAPEDRSGLLPLLQAGLAEGGRLELAASRGGADRVALPLDDSARASLADLLAVFLKAQPLVVAGVIKREALEGQVFSTETGEAPSPAGSAPAAPDSMSSLTTEEAVELERMSTGRGSGRFGDIIWTPPGEQARSVQGLGWMRDRVVIREGDSPVKLVPFSEIGEEHRRKLLTERLSDFSGNRPPETPQGTLYFPEDWTDHQRKSSQGLVFGRDEATGKPILAARGLANKFNGGFITELAIRGEAVQGFVAMPVKAGDNRLETTAGMVWTYANIRVDPRQSAELAKMAGVKALDLRIVGGDDSLTFPLNDNHLLVSLEAIRCYQWATLVP